jgi:hypothetical protein
MRTVWMVLALAGALPAFAQTQSRDDLQPGVNTSALPAPQAAPSAVPAAAAPVGTAAGRAAGSAPAAAAKGAAGSGPAAATKSGRTGKALDRLDLDTTQITGNKELPKVMYVVPWKHSDLGDLTGKPANSLVDEVLQPVDRDVFNREERYYHTVAPEKSPSAPPSGASAAH